MKRQLIAAALAFVPVLACAQTPQEIRFTAANPIKMPAGQHLGEVSGIALDRQGHIYVFQRGHTVGPAYGAAAAQLLEFDAKGKFMREIGAHLYAWSFAHDVRVDPRGNIWAADKGSDMVIKFNQAGEVVWTIGRKPEASDENAHPLEHPKLPLPPMDGAFRQVTDMTWDSKGNTYISDGYINSRVAKIGPDGRWLKSWGSPGKEPGQFNTLHAIAADAQDRIYVADRGNRRIQVFDTEGAYLNSITINLPAPADAQQLYGNRPDPELGGVATMYPGAPWTLCITPKKPGKEQVLFTSDAYPGRIYKLSLDGKLLGYLGGSGRNPGQFGWVHEIACPDENTLYVGELLNWRTQKLMLHPGKK
ncbi:MAG: peptidyl-alpha-hydroxyglycine alpha-amidating lyase family protein [Burkholderiaceae bacterium]|jgi:hypothetical protein|nr:peptidyl-alpha-hydroxyglycine alpha-amidating lyase family protein [Burkholderiaceae bacterium]